MSYSYRCSSTNPYRNLAFERLMTRIAEGPTLLLWQNAPSVIIGRCQNVWAEVNMAHYARTDMYIARRESGGGAVYHDLGNLNYSIIVPRSMFDKQRQTAAMINGLKALGLPASASGRNDILVDGRKVSGSASYMGEYSMQHGTMLLDVDMEAMLKALTPDAAKLKAKGVASVKSRVANMRELDSSITLDRLCAALHEAFSDEYGTAEQPMAEPPEPEGLAEYTARLADREFVFNACPPFDISLEKRFDWGAVELQLSVKKGLVSDAVVFSDALDADMITALPAALKGCGYPGGMAGAVLEALADSQHVRELAEWLGNMR